MKYLTLPISLLQFWYPESIAFFIRSWKNLMLILEEDLAVGLMWRLLLVPLFHDSSIVGRILSFFFRLSRILIGLFAFLFASVALLLIGGCWLILPVLAVFDTPQILSRVLFLSGLGLFFINIVLEPHKKVWQVGKIPGDLWKASKIKPEDLNFKKLLVSQEVAELLSNLEIQLNSFPTFEITDIEDIAKKAFELGRLCGSAYLGPRHFFVAALSTVPNIDTFLLKLELTLSDFKEALIYLEKKRQTWRAVYIWDDDFNIRHLKGVNRGWLGVSTPNLDLVSGDLTKEAAMKGFPDLIRENAVLSEIVNILSQQTGRNVILVGPPGSGKTATLRYLAKQIVTGDAPVALATKRLVLLDLTKLLSGVKTQGELAEKVKLIFEELGFAQNVIIAIEEIHELGMGEVGESLNLYSLMQAYLESDTFQFIGTTEAGNYSKVWKKTAVLPDFSLKLNFLRQLQMTPCVFWKTAQF